MDGERRSPRLQQQAQQQTRKRKDPTPRDPTFAEGSVPAEPATWVECQKGGVTLRALYTYSLGEETVRVQYKGADGGWSEDVKPTYQKEYARLQFAVSGVRVEVRRARLFAYLVHGAPPGDPEDYEADHTEFVGPVWEDRVWAKSTGPVVWLTKKDHGKKHGPEGAAATNQKAAAKRQKA